MTTKNYEIQNLTGTHNIVLDIKSQKTLIRPKAGDKVSLTYEEADSLLKKGYIKKGGDKK